MPTRLKQQPEARLAHKRQKRTACRAVRAPHTSLAKLPHPR
jgi:hypothetical protein